MVAILFYLEDKSAFESEALRIMSQGFDEACNALHVFAGDEHGQRVIAARIIHLARAGVIDAQALRDRVLLEARARA